MLPSGRQIEIASGGQRAVVTAVGATLRLYSVGDRSVVDGFDASDVAPAGRGQVLVPWPNRIADGRYEFAGARHQLPIDEPELGHAIHGLVRWTDWTTESVEADFVCLRYLLPATPGYPFELDLTAEYRLSPSGLAATIGATNVGRHPCPFGAGAHPYFEFPGTDVDALELCVPAEDWLEVDARSIPRGIRSVAHSALDFRHPRVIGGARLDHAFSVLERDPDGLARILLRHEGRSIVVWLDRSFDFVQLYTGDTLPDVGRRRHSVAVEPTTCAPNAFNSGDGLRVLRPGESFRGRWGVALPS